MTQVNVSKMMMSSLFPGIGNYKDVPFSFDIPATTIPSVPNQVTFTKSFAADRANAIAQIQMSFPGLDSNRYIHGGWLETYYNSSFSRIFSPLINDLTLDAYAQFSGNNLTIQIDLFNATFVGPINVPAFRIQGVARLFIPPYA